LANLYDFFLTSPTATGIRRSYEDSDFDQSGLKLPSVIRISRLAVVDGNIFLGKLGQIDPKRLQKIRRKLVKWIEGA